MIRQKRSFWSADKGAALPLVLIMIVILSISMAATAMLQQSTSQALVQNAGGSEKRSALISDALGRAIQDLNFDANGRAVRLAVGDTAGTCPGFPKTYTMDVNKYYQLADGSTAAGSYPRRLAPASINVQCGYRQQSGKTLALASLILTGTGSLGCPADGCQVGRDGGLKINLTGGGSTSCTAVKKRMTFSAGIMNSSGAWSGAGCDTISFPKDVKLVQPALGASCPATANNFKNGNTAVPCTCPASSISEGSGQTATTTNYAWQVTDGGSFSGYRTTQCESDNSGNSADDLDPLQPQTTIAGFMGGVISQLAEPATWSSSSLTSACVSTLNPGIITSAILTTAMNRITACPNGSSKVIQLKPNGIFRIANAQLNTNGYKLVGGTTTGTGANETCSNSPGAQLQFSGTGSLTLDPKESNFLCAFDPTDRSIPTIVAPMSGTTATFSSDAQYFLTYPTGAPNSGVCGLTITGYVFAPGSALQATLNGCASVSLNDAAIVRAMNINATAAVNYTGGAAAPPPFSGDRVVQFQFSEGSLDLGTTQLVIRDFFARRWGVGVSIYSWRTMW